MLTTFYKRYLKLQHHLVQHPMKLIKEGHTFFDIQVATIGDQTHVKLTPDELNRLEQKDLVPLMKRCKYAYHWFVATFQHLKEIQMNQLKDPDQKDQNLPEIDNVKYSDCLKMIYHKAYQKVSAKHLLPKSWNFGTSIKVKNLVRTYEDTKPNKIIYQNIVKDNIKQIDKFLKYIYRMKKQNFLI